MAKSIIDDDGERMIPNFHQRTIMYAEHMTRYIAAKKIAGGKVVLDIASGSGYGTKMLSSVAKKVYGVDVSSDAIKYANNNFAADNVEFILGSAESIPLPDSSVDLVVSFETIEHVVNYESFMKEIKRVLKDDGLAIISTPNDKEFPKGNHFHLHEFNYNEFSNLIRSNFKNQKAYHQATWAYVQIADEKFIGKYEAVDKVEVYNFSPLKKEKYLYFCILCSNRKIVEKIDHIGGLGGHYSARELGEIFNHYQKQIDDHKNEHEKIMIKLQIRERELNAITRSKGYKIVRVLSIGNRGLKSLYNKLRELNPKRIKIVRSNCSHVTKAYDSIEFKSDLEIAANADIAVIIHLYYPNMLDIFKSKLENISHLKYDLFITIPESSKQSVDSIKRKLPNARIAVVPNCGRDVLPFVMIMKSIKDHGYNKILKLHTKKSPHRKDGEKWRDKIIDSLLPSNPIIIDQVIEVLNNKDTAIVGPNGEYTSLLVNFSATVHHVRNLVTKILGKGSLNKLMATTDEYGFFAGTMFWARTKSVMDVVNKVTVKDFEPEIGQVDSTLAHALERLFNIIPEIKGESMYEMDNNKLAKIGYHTSNIPDWSDAALVNKK